MCLKDKMKNILLELGTKKITSPLIKSMAPILDSLIFTFFTDWTL